MQWIVKLKPGNCFANVCKLPLGKKKSLWLSLKKLKHTT